VLASPGDPGDLATKIAALVEDGAAVRVMGQNARRAALQFDRRVAVQAYFDLFSTLVARAQAA
jgi:hypothetical protein